MAGSGVSHGGNVAHELRLLDFVDKGSGEIRVMDQAVAGGIAQQLAAADLESTAFFTRHDHCGRGKEGPGKIISLAVKAERFSCGTGHGLVCSRKFGNIHQLHSGCDFKAACAADHDQPLNAALACGADQAVGHFAQFRFLSLCRAVGAGDDVGTGYGLCKCCAIQHAGDTVFCAGQCGRQGFVAAGDGNQFVATGENFAGNVLADFAVSGDQGDFHGVTPCRLGKWSQSRPLICSDIQLKVSFFVAISERIMDRLTALQVFAEVARRGSFTDAAEALDLSRAKVTRYVAELEQWLGARLLQRSTRRLALTEAGHAALVRHAQVQEILDDLQASAADKDGVPRGLIRITASTSFAQMHLAAALADFRQRYPQVQIDLLAGDRTFNLIEDKIDLAIRTTNNPDPGLVARRLGVCRSVLCASPEYLARAGMPQHPQALEQHVTLTYSYFGKSHWRMSYAGEEISVPVGGAFSANEVGVLLAACEAGAGITMLPTYLAASAMAAGRLLPVLPQWQLESLAIYALYVSRRHIPSTLRCLLDYLAGRFGPEPYWDA